MNHGRPITPKAEPEYLAHEIGVQRQMVADLQVGGADDPPRKGEFGPLWPCGTDEATGKPYNLRELYDHYARALLCIAEVMAREPTT